MPENSKARILIVDDETEMQIFLSNLLKSGGFTAVIAEDYEEGLRKARMGKPDVIILKDMMGKERDRLLFIAIRQDPELAGIPVILLSSLDRNTLFYYLKIQGGKVPEKSLEPDAFLTKPPEAEELLRLVHLYTDRK